LTATCYTVDAQNVVTVNIRPRFTKHIQSECCRRS